MYSPNRGGLLRVLGLLIVAVLLTALEPGMQPRGDGGVVVGVYFYPWYSATHGRHWNDTMGNIVIDEPLIGYYDSDDPAVIRWQLGLIRDAGVDFIILSWWGPDSFEDNTSRVIAGYLGEYGLKFAVMVEPFLGSEHPEYYNRGFWEEVLSYLDSNLIKPYSDVYMHLHGKPLILAFNPIGMKYNPSSDFPGYTVRMTGNDIDNAGYQDWDYWPDYINASSVELRVRRDGMVSVAPRFDDAYFRSPGRRVDPDYSLRLYEREWEWILSHRDGVRIVVITSWNEYHERTMIEPHYDRTASTDPFYAYNITREYISRLKTANAPSTNSESSYYILASIPLLAALYIAVKALRTHRRTPTVQAPSTSLEADYSTILAPGCSVYKYGSL